MRHIRTPTAFAAALGRDVIHQLAGFYSIGEIGCHAGNQRDLTAFTRSEDDGSHPRVISGYTVVLRDVTKSGSDSVKLKEMLTTDHLTGACNRAHFFEVAERAGGAWLRLICILAVVIASAIANAIAAQAAVSRILFAMARDGKLPAVFAKVHPRYKTPYVSTLVVALVSLLVGLFFADRIDNLTRIVNFGALTGFVLLHLSVINHYFIRRRSGDWLRHMVFPVLGLSIILYVLYEMDRSAKILGASWIGIGVLYYLILASRSKKPVALEI